jgi:Protein of unknown function (DUF3987)
MSPDHKIKTAAALSEIWDGKGIRRLRAGDSLVLLPGPRLALHIMIQPEAATSFMADPMLRDQGLLSRVLVAQPKSLAGTRQKCSRFPSANARLGRCDRHRR